MYKGDLLYDNSLNKKGEKVTSSQRPAMMISAFLLVLLSLGLGGFAGYLIVSSGFEIPGISLVALAVAFVVIAVILYIVASKQATLRVYEHGIDLPFRESMSDSHGKHIPFKKIVKIIITKGAALQGKEPNHVLGVEYVDEKSSARVDLESRSIMNFRLFMQVLEGHVSIEREGFEEGENEFGKKESGKKKGKGKKGATGDDNGAGESDEGKANEEPSLLKVETHSKTIYKDTNLECPKCGTVFTRTFEVEHLVNKTATVSCPKCRKIFERKFTEADL